MDQLEPGVSVCSEWTGRRQGSVDFYIPGAKWAIQLPRDGNQPKEHCDRFTTGGIYTHGLWGGDIQDWLVLDFRHFKPRKPGNVVYHPLCLVWYLDWFPGSNNSSGRPSLEDNPQKGLFELSNSKFQEPGTVSGILPWERVLDDAQFTFPLMVEY